jgi:hypothetical protein
MCFPPDPDYPVGAVSNFYEISQRYSRNIGDNLFSGVNYVVVTDDKLVLTPPPPPPPTVSWTAKSNALSFIRKVFISI